MSKVGSWLAGILAVVIGSYIGWYLTVGRNTHTTTNFEGMVYSDTGPISGAKVTLELSGKGTNGGQYHDFTDARGSYNFEVTDLPEDASAILIVGNPGYQALTPFWVPKPLTVNNRQDFPLTPLNPPHAVPGVPLPHPGVLPVLPTYFRKSAAIKIQGKK